MAFDEHGRGPNVVLLVHGHPFDRTMWRPQIDAITGAGWRVIVPDLRGYGESTVVPGRTLLSDFAADLAALLDGLAVPAVVIVGLSMGGQIAMDFARQYPHRVRGLLLTATFPQSETVDGRQARITTADRLLREGMDRYTEELLPQMLAPQTIREMPEVVHHVETMMRETDPRGAAAALRGRAERPAYDDTLAGVAVPALIIGGSADAFMTRQDAERMCALLRDCEMRWLESVGHMPNLERPDEFNAGLLDLMHRVGSPDQSAAAPHS
ncbi:MAG: alpha/beta hydrolase [bacterium]